MKSNKCKNCGANIDLKTMSCKYCGSTYIQPTEAAPKPSSSFSSSTLGTFLSDITKALKPLDDAIKPVYDEISGGIKKGVENAKANKPSSTNQPTERVRPNQPTEKK